MSLHIKSRHCTVDDTLKAYVQKKLDRLPRYYHKVHGIEVIFTEEKIGVSCEIEVIAPPMHVVASVQDKDARAAFDKAQKVVERQLKREKARMIDARRQSGDARSPSAPATPIDEIAALDELEDEVEADVDKERS